MRARLLVPLLFLLFALSIAAQDVNLSLSAHVVGVPHYTARTEIAVEVANAGPSAATNVTVTSTQAMEGELDSRCTRLSGEIQFRCVASRLEAGASVTFRAQTGSHSSIQPLVFPFQVRADQNDPFLENNEATVIFNYVDENSALVSVTPPASLDANRVGVATVTFTNRSPYDTAGAQLTFWITALERVVSSDPLLPCTVIPAPADGAFGTISCVLPSVPINVPREFPFEVQLQRQGRTGFSTEVRWASMNFWDYEEKTYYRPFVVTNTNDEGAGSLRQALLDANAYCTHDQQACRIEFAIADATASGWHTIRPLTALPDVTARWLVIDGASQTRRADTNAAGPEIVLDGAATRGASGISFFGRTAEVHGLVIGNFERHGIAIEKSVSSPDFYQGQYTIAGNYLGVDPTGTQAMPNGSRGVMITSGYAQIHDNVLSGNVRSGIYFWGPQAQIQRNRIGVAAASDAPLPNGASGIFIGTHPRGTGASTVSDNVIAYSGHFGVALAADSVTTVGANRIFRNFHGGIDIKLDGPTVDFPSGGSPSVPATPTITRAVFDGEATIIEGFGVIGGAAGSAVSRPLAVGLYANTEVDRDGFAEGEQFIGEATVGGDLKFWLRVPGDLRGRWITGIALQHSSFFGGEWTELASSEFSRPVRVE